MSWSTEVASRSCVDPHADGIGTASIRFELRCTQGNRVLDGTSCAHRHWHAIRPEERRTVSKGIVAPRNANSRSPPSFVPNVLRSRVVNGRRSFVSHAGHLRSTSSMTGLTHGSRRRADTSRNAPEGEESSQHRTFALVIARSPVTRVCRSERQQAVVQFYSDTNWVRARLHWCPLMTDQHSAHAGRQIDQPHHDSRGPFPTHEVGAWCRRTTHRAAVDADHRQNE